MYRFASILVVFLLVPTLSGAVHQDVAFCGDGIVEEGEKCIYDVGLTSQCWKAGAKIGLGNHYQVGEICEGYDARTKSSTGETGVCLTNQICWIGGDVYQGAQSRIAVMDKASGLEEFILIYIYDPGRSRMRGYQTDANLKEVLEGPDHWLSNFCNGRAPCVHNNEKGSSRLGDRHGKWNGYVKNSQPGVLVPVTDFSNWFEEVPSEGEKADWYQTKPKTKPHIPYFGIKQQGEYVFAIIDARGDRVESESFFVCADVECESTKISGEVKDGHGFLVPDMEVILSQETPTANDLVFTTYTDDDGHYDFDVLIDAEAPVRLSFTLKGEKDDSDQERFLIYDEKAELGSTFNSPDQPVTATTKFMPIAELPATFDFISSLDLLESANIGDREQLDDFARIHYFVARAMKFAEDTLGVPMNDGKPLSVRGNNARPISFYTGYNHAFYLDEGDTLWDGYDKPDNSEWHEISHGIMYQSNVGGKNKFPDPRHDYGEFNHLGMANPGTTDSWVEGFATFMSAVMQNELEYEGEQGDEPWIYQYSDSSSIHLDDNLKVWDSMGRKESFAVATLLWDFYDSRTMYGGKDDEDESLSIDVLWSALNSEEVRDMKDVYDALSIIVPQNTVDEIFISHGFYNDFNGNRKFDDDEEVGLAANGGAFFTDFDFDKNGYGFYDVNTQVGRWLQGGTERESASITSDDWNPRWGSADIDGDGDIATLIMSPDGDSYDSAAIDSDEDSDFGPLTDLDGDGKAELTENPFWVMPFPGRRSMMEFPEEMIDLTITDKAGENVAESYVVMKYEYENDFAYRNYQTRARVDGSGQVSIWVPEGATLTINAEAGEYKGEGKTITYVDFVNNLAPRSNQGEMMLALPTTKAEIVEAIEAERQEKEEATAEAAEEDSSASDDADEHGIPIWVILLGLFALVVVAYIYKSRRK